MITSEQIQQKRDESARVNKELLELGLAYAEQECPFAVWDIVEVKGYTYKGKKMQVIKIVEPRHGLQYGNTWRVIGIVLKKDGTFSKALTEMSQYQYEKSKA
jgi:hypothetical protein